MAAGAVAVAALGYVPVPVAVRGVAVFGIILHRRRTRRCGSGRKTEETNAIAICPALLASTGLPPTRFLGGDAPEDEMPSFWLAVPQERAWPSPGARPSAPQPVGSSPRATSSMWGDGLWRRPRRAGVTTIGLAIWAWTWLLGIPVSRPRLPVLAPDPAIWSRQIPTASQSRTW